MTVALYPGAFKPPHRGHFELVKGLLNGTANGTVYTLDNLEDRASSALTSKNKDYSSIDKVVVFIGGKSRNGLTPEVSKKIWEVYAKYLPGTIELYDKVPNPMLNAKEYAKKRPEDSFYAVTGIRGEEDMIDLKRLSTFKNLENVEGLIIGDSTEGESVRATNMRNAILRGSLDDVLDFFPKELTRKEILELINMIKNSIIAEQMSADIDTLFGNWFPKTTVTEGSSGTPTKLNSILKSEDRQKLQDLYSELNQKLNDKEFKVEFNQNHIRIAPSDQVVPASFDYTPFMGSLLEYMLEERMSITPLPEIKIRRDEVEAQDFFGKTAYYDPNSKEIVLYVQGRHPKDVMRSFSHEMIHHIQNIEGRLGDIRTQNTNESDVLVEIEKEAYMLGNITFRNWEDKVKNETQTEDVDGKKAFSREIQMSEGRYDTLTNRLSSLAFETFKDAHDIGRKRVEFEFKVGNPEYDEDVDIESNQFEFDFLGVATFTEDTYQVDGGANAGFDKHGDEIQPMINVNFQIPKNPDWQEVSFDLKDVVRHELEHLTQDGENLKQGKYIPDDQDLRTLIDNGLLDKDAYFTLPKEVDAMIQGLYFKAKKSKKPFSDVVDDYLNKAMISLDNKEKVRILWNKRLPALGINQRL